MKINEFVSIYYKYITNFNCFYMVYKIALFGEAEKGDFAKPLHFQSVNKLAEFLGNPPKESLGIFFAIQALLYNREVFFFRVQEEGFSKNHYFTGLKNLENEIIGEISAIGLPGVGDEKIINLSTSICETYKCILVTTEKDLYDYLTSFKQSNSN